MHSRTQILYFCNIWVRTDHLNIWVGKNKLQSSLRPNMYSLTLFHTRNAYVLYLWNCFVMNSVWTDMVLLLYNPNLTVLMLPVSSTRRLSVSHTASLTHIHYRPAFSIPEPDSNWLTVLIAHFSCQSFPCIKYHFWDSLTWTNKPFSLCL